MSNQDHSLTRYNKVAKVDCLNNVLRWHIKLFIQMGTTLCYSIVITVKTNKYELAGSPIKYFFVLSSKA